MGQRLYGGYGKKRKGMDTDTPVTAGEAPGPQAYSRFTKSPITFGVRSGRTWTGDVADYEEPTGAYGGTRINPNTAISVEMDSRSPYKDLNHAIHHEDIHAATLQDQGVSKALGTDIPNAEIDNQMRSAWDNSDRAGRYRLEMPAYLGAHKPGQIQEYSAWTGRSGDVSPKDRKAYLDSYKQQLSDPAKSLLDRIIRSHEASQGQ